jgi:uncharacterized protein (TIGR00304 family)
MRLIEAGILFILAGFVLVFAGIILSAGDASFGGLIMIGPIPIAFGSSQEMTGMAMIIGLLLMLLFFILWRKNA